MAQLKLLEPWWRDLGRCWVTFAGADAESLLEGETTYWAYHPTTRNIPNLFRNLFLSIRVIWRERPGLIVSNGAGVALPFFYVARLFGARTVFIEVYDRVDSASLTGRLCRPVTSLLLLQWDQQRTAYGRGEVIGPLY